MYRQSYQRGMLTIFYSVGSKPLALWDTYTQDGYISRFLDPDIKSMVLEIGGTNVSTTYMICPNGNKVLGITMPFLVMIVKNLKKYFSFEVTVLDATGTRRRFRVSNFQSTTQVLPLCTVMPISLSDGWNQIQFNLAEFTRRAYKIQFVETQKIKINANIRIRRIYFAERILPENELPSEFKIFYPMQPGDKGKKDASAPMEKETLKTNSIESTTGTRKPDVPTKKTSKTSKTSMESKKKPGKTDSKVVAGAEAKESEIEEGDLEQTGEETKVPSEDEVQEAEEDNVGQEELVEQEVVQPKETEESLITEGDNKTELEGYEGDVEVETGGGPQDEDN